MKETNLKNRREKVSVNFFDRRIDFMNMEEIVQIISDKAIKHEKLFIASYNVHGFNLSMQLNEFLEYQKNADIARCDGMGIIKGLSLMGYKLPLEYKISGTELIPKLVEQCHQNNLSIFLLGTKPEILELAIFKQKEKYHQLKIAGYHGYFDKADTLQNKKVIQKINCFSPDILVVGMGMPIQEIWIQKNRKKIKANIIIPCGAVIDRLAGLVSDCPKFMSDAGLEWLYRLIREPKRLAARYLLGNLLFLFHILWAKYNNPDAIYLIGPENFQAISKNTNKIANL